MFALLFIAFVFAFNLSISVITAENLLWYRWLVVDNAFKALHTIGNWAFPTAAKELGAVIAESDAFTNFVNI